MSEKEINPLTENPRKHTRKTTEKKKKSTINVEAFSDKAKDLPVLRDSKGSAIALTVENINRIGTDTGANVGRLADQVLQRVKVADSGEFGQSVTNILTLTRSVNIESLGTPRDDWFSKLKGYFVNIERKVKDQIDTSHDQIQEIVKTLDGGISRMKSEAEWLANTYEANKENLFELRDIHEVLKDVEAVEQNKLNGLLSDETTEMHVIDEQKMIVEALSKQKDKIHRLILICELNAPQIMSMRKVNVNTIDKFETLTSTVIPAWKTQMSLGLVSDAQRKDTELGNLVDNETNRLLISNSAVIAHNMKETAKSGQRGVVDIKTLRDAQKQMIDGIKETIAIEQKGREERRQAAIEMENMSNELRETLREIADQSHKSK